MYISTCIYHCLIIIRKKIHLFCKKTPDLLSLVAPDI